MDVLSTCAQASDIMAKMQRACARQSARVDSLAPIEGKLRASLTLRQSDGAKRIDLTRQISTMRSLLVALPPSRASALTLGLYAVHLHASCADPALVCDFYRCAHGCHAVGWLHAISASFRSHVPYCMPVA